MAALQLPALNSYQANETRNNLVTETNFATVNLAHFNFPERLDLASHWKKAAETVNKRNAFSSQLETFLSNTAA
jgi:hypothetical protein